MKIEKEIMLSLQFPYSVSAFGGDAMRIFAAPEKKGRCVNFAPGGGDVETVWDGELGGTTGLCQLPGGNDEFLAIEGFYKGLQCEGAGIIHVRRENGGWQVRRLCDLPFAHRLCLAQVDGETHVIVGTLCRGKIDREDWSQPGKIYVGLWRGDELSLELRELSEDIHQHHGMYRGRRDGREVILVSGREGVFEIAVPGNAEEGWTPRRLLDEPIGDVCPYDIDGDGVDELLTVKDFHGNEMVVYKETRDGWQAVYSFPICYGHFVWGGKVCGEDVVITGYRRSNGGLVLLRKIPGEWRFDIIHVDQLEAPVNMEVVQENGRTMLFTTSENTHRVVKYTISE